MAYEFKLPDVGEGIHEGEIVKLHVKEGDRIQEDDIFAEVQTDKAVVEIPSPVTGIVKEMRVKEGEVAVVGSVLAVFEAEGDAAEGGKEEKVTEEPYANAQEQAKPMDRLLEKEAKVEDSAGKTLTGSKPKVGAAKRSWPCPRCASWPGSWEWISAKWRERVPAGG